MSVYKIFILLVFNRECMERNVLTSFRKLSSFKYFLPYFQTKWSVFLPFSVNCSQVVMFQIMPVSAQTGGGGGGSQKFPNLCGYPLWMTSNAHACCSWLIFPFHHNLLLFFMFPYLSLFNYFCHIMFYTCFFLNICKGYSL